ncbi:MAG TPA: choice-of-anchor tandem repeat GloVer-containing protein [Chthonomonas sp.]|uniref:choice-of-anchor tandem repeat GloVer-containing protein n=1 Tax=Chthonomonas sp. TaxID=2282153 RepID=UPI002B4AEAE7|nr:choice-of-anchor tandem repeat GloVer-containing protein [Chthonomonas sp.]HLH79897.1 choice-of-anchor tandem repeat GloVer-containing protein [Chthonomonas sp.]
MHRVWRTLSWLCFVGLWPYPVWALPKSQTYYTPPSPLLYWHRLTFRLPEGWQLRKATVGYSREIRSLPISKEGLLRDSPFRDMNGLTLELGAKNHPKQCLTLWVQSSWLMDGKDLGNFTPRAPFRTAFGLKGWWSPESFIVGTQRFGGLLRLDVPPAQGATINLDRTYGTMILLGLNTTQPQRRLRAFQERLLLALGKSIRISTQAAKPSSWVLAAPKRALSGLSYALPPSALLFGQRISLTLPRGWHVFPDKEGQGSGWIKNFDFRLAPIPSDAAEKLIRCHVETDEIARLADLRNGGCGYPFQTQQGLHGFLEPLYPISSLSFNLYLPQSRVTPDGFPRGYMLQFDCDFPPGQTLQTVWPVVGSLLSSLRPEPPFPQSGFTFNSEFSDYLINTPIWYFSLSSLRSRSERALYGAMALHGHGGVGALYRLSPNGTGFRVLHSFAPLQPDFSNQDGAFPFAPLAQDAHQHLYGTTSTGGPACDGTLFTLQPDGSHFRLLHAFSGPDGALPYAGVLPSQDGWLYGVTEEGGPYGKGVVYRIREDGTGFQVLHSFGGREGAYPLLVELVEGEGGWLYGVTSGGGVYGNGVVFGVKADGSGYRVLHEFGAEDGLGRNGDGSHPYCGLVLGVGGWLYGVTYGGGVYGAGVVFRVREDGSDYRVLHAFTGRDGRWGMGGLVRMGGKLYGVTYSGGRYESGVVYVVGEDGSGYQVLHDFGKGAAGLYPYGLLSVGHGGWLYGVTEGGGVGGQGVVYRLRVDGSGFGVVYDFGKRLKKVLER